MTGRASYWLLFCFLFQICSGLRLIPWQTEDHTAMTEGRAVSILRLKAGDARADFVIIRKIDPTSNTARVSEQSLLDARSRHLEVYGTGVLADLMRSGGFVVLQIDKDTGIATKLHVVTTNEAGESVVHSESVHTDLAREEASSVMKRAEEFSCALLSSQVTHAPEVLRSFGAQVTIESTSGGQGYLELPRAITGFARQPEALLNLSGLYSARQLWHIRLALAMSIYAASPHVALEEAARQQAEIERIFFTQKNKSSDFADHLFNLESIRSASDLTARVQWLRELDSFLEDQSSTVVKSATYAANLTLCAVPLNVGVEQDANRLFGVMTASGLISVWAHAESGEFILAGISEGE